MPEIDQAFLALPFERLADAALGRARDLGATYADFRFERRLGQTLTTRDRSSSRSRTPRRSASASAWSPEGSGASHRARP